MVSSYLTDIIVLLIAAVVIVPLSQAARLGAVPGFVLAGLVVGPYGLGLVKQIHEIGNFAEIGVVLLLFVIGIELKPSRLWQMRRLVFGLGIFQVLLTGAAIGGISYFFFEVPPRAAMLIGPALALSSTAFVLQLLTVQRSLTSEYGQTSIAVLLLQDLAVVPLLVLVPLLATPDMGIGKDISFALTKSLLILALVVLAGRYFLHPILHRVALSGSSEVFTVSAVLIVLGTALVTEHAGLSMAMGAFLAGLLISDSYYRIQVLAEIQPFRGLLLGLFFMSMGMSLNVELLIQYPLLTAGLLCLLLLLKIIILIPLCYLFGLKNRLSMAVSIVLAQSGEFALVLFSLAFQSDILDKYLYQQLLLVVLLSMLVTPLLAYLAQQILKSQPPGENDTNFPEEAPIVLAGYGRVGRRIGQMLSTADKAFVALDSDAKIVQKARANGDPVFYGDVRKPEVINAAGASGAEVIIVTLNDPKATVDVVSSLRKIYPEKNIFARGHSLSQCKELRRLGASGVVSENMEASLELARLAMLNSGIEEDTMSEILQDFRQSYHAQIYDDKTLEKSKAAASEYGS